jgi:hypothetical protein
MAGLSRRFTEAGYAVPKYMLEARGRSLFAHAVDSFSAYFKTEPFMFIVRDVAETPDFVRQQCRELGVRQADVIVLQANTRGQAETVFLGIEQAAIADDQPITIFNIDTFRPGFRFPSFQGKHTDGYLEVFRGSGANWSYVRSLASGSDIAAETAEKRPISDLCCTGLYHFGSVRLFRLAYGEYLRDFINTGMEKELYVAPIYNILIQNGFLIRYSLIEADEVIFCGIPVEYDAFRIG